MNLKYALITLTAVLTPAAALADHDDWNDEDRYPSHVHDHSCNHGAPTPMPTTTTHPATPGGQPSQAGRYELRTVRKWEPARYEQVFVPGFCREKRRRHMTITRCTEGRYEHQLVPGRYIDTQEYVWVPYAPRQYQPSVHVQVNQPRFGVRFEGRL